MNKSWNAQEYQNQCMFVPSYGKGLLPLMGDVRGKTVLDIGCGSGVLTEEIHKMGAVVHGIDASVSMIALAKSQFPDLDLSVADALSLPFQDAFDVVFSNAVFHWVEGGKQQTLLSGVRKALHLGGTLVCEMGGKGCGESVHHALSEGFARRGFHYVHPFYFPSIGQYAPISEACHLQPVLMQWFPRPTKMNGRDGLKNWISMFVTAPFAGMEEEMRQTIIQEAEDRLRNQLFDGTDWIIDYTRLRVVATAV
jgi:trans-aconitate methyltransferase